jgi:hypothetical protein
MVFMILKSVIIKFGELANITEDKFLRVREDK